ncbi:MAG: TRAP transporter fused permease subunit [Rhodospirillales bacterium]|nr:TRAP transporter fused permease subunit [Rhodospirillales bacterium]MCW8953285.1 TRAP transporter fused permease subunit [Rhodospirillales bacterium]MCW8970647.1 TRAP transporter fused permease subunit [Rhodospirillales bacterium]
MQTENPSVKNVDDEAADDHVRSEDSILGKALFWIGVTIALAHIYFNTLGTLSENWVSAIHFGGFGLLCALRFPMFRAARKSSAMLVLDIVLGLLALASALYMILAEDALYNRGVHFNWMDWSAAVIAILLAIEFTRRTTGLIIPVLIILALTYSFWWGKHIDGMFSFAGLSVETILFRSYFGGDGMFGMIARISSTYIFMFILFGAFLIRSGAGEFVIDFARAIAGRFTGGQGFVAVMGSGLMGTISGSAVANTVSTGVITIPLMKRAGFPPRFAAGVEAAASTGGQLMPPIMGAGAFVMASYTQVPYTEIIAVAALPALMYFLSVGFWVRIEAKRMGVAVLDKDVPRMADVFRRGGPSFLIPITILIGLLASGFTPTYAAGIGIVAVVAASWLTPHRMGPRAVLEALALGAKNMIPTAVLLVAVGLIVNIIATTGIGNTFSLMISDWAGGSLIISIILIGLASLVLGMGLPVTAAYIVLGTLSAPALYDLIAQRDLIEALTNGQIAESAKVMFMLFAPERMAEIGLPMSQEAATSLVALVPPENLRAVIESGLSPAVLTAALLSAHMIIFWLSQDSNVTPPVCLAAFAAAAIAGTPPMRTGLTAWKVSKALYVMPVLFAYTPFLYGDYVVAFKIFAFGSVGLYALTAAIDGHLEASLSWFARAVLLAGGVALLWPDPGYLIAEAGLIAFLAIFIPNVIRDRREQASPSNTSTVR